MRFAESSTGQPRLDRAAAERIARGLRAMADPTRVQILSLIVDAPGGRRAVTGLADELSLTQPTVSHHLRLMAEAGILESKQDGRLVWSHREWSTCSTPFGMTRSSPP
jgi:arsenate reductase